MRQILAALLIAIGFVGFEIPWQTEIPDTAVGVWECHDLGTRTPLYRTQQGSGQDIIDNEDSALLMDYYLGRAILDHAGSDVDGGTWDVREIRVDSAAFLVTADKTERYRCYEVVKARNGYPYTANGTGIFPQAATDIICVSCANEDGSEVYVALFKLEGEMP